MVVIHGLSIAEVLTIHNFYLKYLTITARHIVVRGPDVLCCDYPPREGTPEVAETVPSLFLLSAAWVGRSPPLFPKAAGGLSPPREGTPC